MADEAILRLENIVKSYDKEGNEVVKGISLEVKKGEFLTILGPSGCGKTTTLRIIAGFESINSGKVFIESEDVSNLPPYKRTVNTVFQNYALFPHMNVFENIAFGLTMRKTSKSYIKDKVNEMLKVVRLEGYEDRMPDQLSGGQKQRVAIARAIINNPKVLLLDEPLGALDLKLRKEMQIELKHLQKTLGITFIYVTHDQEEALTMSDRIAVMNEGRIEQIASPEEIYENPMTKFVADFIGETNIIEGEISAVEKGNMLMKLFSDQNIRVSNKRNKDFNVGDKILVAIRPEKLKLKKSPASDEQWLKGRLKERIYVGASVKTVVELKDGNELVINDFSNDKSIGDEENIFVTWKVENAVVMKA